MVLPSCIAMLSVFTSLLADMNLWYSLPLIVSVSLVCAATRHELIGPILNHAIRFALWIAVFMGAVMALLALMAWLA